MGKVIYLGMQGIDDAQWSCGGRSGQEYLVVHRVPGSNSFACSVASANRKEADNNNNNNKNETEVGT